MAAGSIVVDLLMKTGSFETDTKRAEKRSQEMAREIDKAFKVVGLAAIAAGTAFAAMTKSVINNADAVAKAARSIGVTTESLSALQFAADLSGVSTQELTVSLDRLNRVASQGNKAFDAMGISVKDAQGNLKATDTLLKEISDKFVGYTDGAEKSALAQELFGRSGAKMISFLNLGSAGLDEMRQEAERLGIIIGGDLANNSEIFNDNLIKMRSAFEGMVMTVANDVVPILVELTNGINNSETGMSALKNTAKAISTVFQAVAILGANVAFVFQTIGREIGATAAQIALFSQLEFSAALNIGQQVRDDAIKAREALDDLERRILGLGGQQVTSSVNVVTGTTTTGAAPLIGGSKKESDEAKKRLDDYHKEIAKFDEATRNRQQQMHSQRLDEQAALEFGYQQLLTEYEEAESENRKKIHAQRLQEQEDAEKGYWGRWLEAAEEAMTSFNDLASAVINNFTTGFGNAFEKIVFDSKNLSDAVKNLTESMARSVVNAIGQMAAQWVAKEAVKRLASLATTSTVVAGTAATTTAGVAANAVAATSAVATGATITAAMAPAAVATSVATGGISTFTAIAAILGAIALIPMFAGSRERGGDVIGGRSYLVGENGPEMFTPRGTGSISPNGSGGTIVQNINITTGVAQTVRAEIISLMPQIVNAAKTAVSDARQRGGSYASSMR